MYGQDNTKNQEKWFYHIPLSIRDFGSVPSLLVDFFLFLWLGSWIGTDSSMALGVHSFHVFGVDTGLNTYNNAEKTDKIYKNLPWCIERSVSWIFLHLLLQESPCIQRRGDPWCVSCGLQRWVHLRQILGIALESVECPNQHQQHPSRHRRYEHQLRFWQDQYPNSIGMMTKIRH